MVDTRILFTTTNSEERQSTVAVPQQCERRENYYSWHTTHDGVDKITYTPIASKQTEN